MTLRPTAGLLVAAAMFGGAVAVETVVVQASIRSAAEDRCKRYEKRALSKNSRAVVLWIRSSEPELSPTLSTCRRRDGQIGSLDSPIDGITAFPPPAISLVGGRVAFALQVAPSNAPDDSGLDEYITTIGIYDIETDRQRFVRRVGPARLMKIGSLVLSDRGSMAWIACPEPRREPERARFGPTCDRPGSRDYVYVLPKGESRPRRVGTGRRIDPNSLKRRGDAITWRDGRSSKQARLQ